MVVLGLGSNCGNRLEYLRGALHRLRSPGVIPKIKIQAISPIYESDALLPENAPEDWNQPYLNVNLLCETQLQPLELLQLVKSIEKELGRKPRGRWAPREIDIDILAMGETRFDSESLKIPHPSLSERPFALLPFADLLPHSPLLPSQEKLEGWRRKPVDQVPFRTRRSLFHLTQIVGILNLTPDSFSDGGQYLNPTQALQHAEILKQQGITILDVGAESTRPRATPVSPAEEWNRLAPLLEKLDRRDTLISVDTRHAEVAKKAIQAGVHWINDVSGLNDPAMQNVVADSEVDVVMMHSLSVPPVPGATLSIHLDPIVQIKSWAEQRIQDLESRGISRNRIIFDPGLGFGKTVEQSWEILRGIQQFQELGVRIFVGHSRKSFLSSLTQVPASERDIETLTLSLDLASQGVDYIRVHQTEMHARALKAWTQVNGIVRCRN